MPRICQSVLLVVACATASAAAAQDVFVPFSFPDGTLVPGFTESGGDWRIVSGEVESESRSPSTRQLLLRNGGTDFGHAVEATVIHSDTTGPSAGGVVMRYDTTRTPPAYVYLAFRDRVAPYDGFDSYEIGYCNGQTCGVSPQLSGSTPIGQRIRVVLQYDDANNRLITYFVNGKVGGSWSLFPSSSPVGAGSMGLVAQGRVRFDDLGYYAATVWPTTGLYHRVSSPPYVLNGYGAPGETFIGAASLSLGRVSLPGQRQLPVAVDGLFLLSLANPLLFLSAGTTHPQTGAFTMTMTVPKLPALAGVRVYLVAATTNNGVISEITAPRPVRIAP